MDSDNSDINLNDSGSFRGFEENLDSITNEKFEELINQSIILINDSLQMEPLDNSSMANGNSPTLANSNPTEKIFGTKTTPSLESVTDNNTTERSMSTGLVRVTRQQENNSTSISSSCVDSSEQSDNILLLNSNDGQTNEFEITINTESISMDQLEDHDQNALQVLTNSTNSLDSVTSLPTQHLTEQVSELQLSGDSTHQQNVLLNSQNFAKTSTQSSSTYPSAMYPLQPGQPPPMYQPYQYQPNPMYYPAAPPYPPGPCMAPRPIFQQNQQMVQQSMPPHPSQQPMALQHPISPQHSMSPQNPLSPQHPISPQQPIALQQSTPPQLSMPSQQPLPPPQQPSQYRQTMPLEAPGRRQSNRQPQGPTGPRQRARIVRTRGGMASTSIRYPRPKILGGVNSPQINKIQNSRLQGQPRVVKRTPERMQAKKKRMDIRVPDTNDDADCQIVGVQYNTDSTIPQTESVQDGTPASVDNVMCLSDSITLSVRNPPPKPQSPKKSDTSVVTDILKTRGITVIASTKPKEKPPPTKEVNHVPAVEINLNGAVSIIPTTKSSTCSSDNNCNTNKSSNVSQLPIVDLTDDPVLDIPVNSQNKQKLPFSCDRCPAQYPTVKALNSHQQRYHRIISSDDFCLPLIDLKDSKLLQKLSDLGIYNFIPLSANDETRFAFPVFTVNCARNSQVSKLDALGATSFLTLGPARSTPVVNNK